MTALETVALTRMRRRVPILPGLGLAALIAVAGTVIGQAVPLVGSAVPSVVLGGFVALVHRPGRLVRPGIEFAGRYVLQTAVVLFGCQLSLSQIARVGLGSLPVMVGTLIACLLAAWLIGRVLRVVGDLRTLIGVGTGICGASAIAAVSPVIGAAGAEVAYAISVIFVFNVAAVLLFPLLGHALGLGQHAFGLFAGTAVNDTSSVVATAATYGPEAASYAVVVKLVRTLMIIPVCLVLAALVARRARRVAGGPAPQAMTAVRAARLVPWFLVGFVIMAAGNSVGGIPAGLQPVAHSASSFLVATALAGIGLSTDLSAIRRAGPRPLLLGALLWSVVTASSLGLQALISTVR